MPRRRALLVASALLFLAVLVPGIVHGDLAEQRTNPQPNNGQCRAGLTPGRAQPLIIRYYAREGEWAGQYIIREIAQMRMERSGPGRAEAHVRYLYHCVIDNCSGGQDDGYDQRVFHFDCRNDRWRVTRMDGYMSAQL